MSDTECIRTTVGALLLLKTVLLYQRIPITMSTLGRFEGQTDANKACYDDHLQIIYKGLFCIAEAEPRGVIEEEESAAAERAERNGRTVCRMVMGL
jgi:hypothetical protein